MADNFSIFAAIVSGDADNDLSEIIQACHDRKKAIAQSVFYTLRVGDRVRMKSGRPRYLDGKLGTVSRKNQSTVDVDLDEPVGRFHRGIRCPVELLEKIS